MTISTQIRCMTTSDYQAISAMLAEIAGVSKRDADSLEGFTQFLRRNPSMSFVAVAGSKVIGCAMAGHDGRRGYLHHVCVVEEWRSQGIGGALVGRSLDALVEAGIAKVHLDVLASNEFAMGHWNRRGWIDRTDIRRFSIILRGGANA